jgi:hypothetical protein
VTKVVGVFIAAFSCAAAEKRQHKATNVTYSVSVLNVFFESGGFSFSVVFVW